MARTFEMTAQMRRGTDAIAGLLRTGLPMGPVALLSVRGRKTGIDRTTPVAVLRYQGDRWLVAAFGEVGWVRNIRASSQATLIRGRRSEPIRVAEMSAAEAAPVLKQYFKTFGIVPFMRPYFEVTPDAPLADYAREVLNHPVFRIIRGG
jgi:deazaflavin-dependent oxidoreductase (nitroreductase family)